MTTSGNPHLFKAVRIWSGSGQSAWPRRDEVRLVDRFGAEAASLLCKEIKTLEEEFYSTDAWQEAANLREMGEVAAKEFKIKHPDVPDEVVQIFTWCYTYDNR